MCSLLTIIFYKKRSDMSYHDLEHKYRIYRFNSVAISEILDNMLNFVGRGSKVAKAKKSIWRILIRRKIRVGWPYDCCRVIFGKSKSLKLKATFDHPHHLNSNYI